MLRCKLRERISDKECRDQRRITLQEIALATGVTRETAKSRLRYAMNRLRQGMREWR